MYCIRNGIQTIRLYCKYNTLTLSLYECGFALTETRRGTESYTYENCEYCVYYLSPLHFYEYCAEELHNINIVKKTMRQHMHKVCPKPAMFIDMDDPF